jgi:septum site-determining protein MinD
MKGSIAIAGGKGGCGKTTTAVGLALALGRAGEAPLVADADHELPDLHLVANVDRHPGLDAVADGVAPTAAAQPMPDAPESFVLPAGGIDVESLATALTRVANYEGVVLLDTPAGAGRDAAVPIRAADRTLLVTATTKASLEDTAKTAAMARELGTPPLGAVVVEPHSSGGAEMPDVSDVCPRLFGCPCLGRVPRVSGHPLAAPAVRTTCKNVARKVQERNI